jgi:hypothetical protein
MAKKAAPKKKSPRVSVSAKRPAAAKKAAAARKPAPDRMALADSDRELVARLSERTGLLPREILERALAGYAAAVAPGMPLHAPPPTPRGPGEEPALRLFLSIDGKPEVAINKKEFVLGSGPETDLRLDLPLISPRHARILWREGRHVFEDLRSARGSFQHGQPVDVRFIETGDEIDLGGFLPVRFRLE